MKRVLCLILALLITGCSVPVDNEELKPTPSPVEEVKTPEPTIEVKTQEPTEPPKKPDSNGVVGIYDEDFSNVDNKGEGWGFKKVKGDEPEIYNSTKELFRKYDTYYLDERKTKTIYLTFDEGYENGYTSVILDTLKEYGVKAAFFITGSYMEREKELVDRMVNEGHIVGNHTVNHPNLPKLGSAEKMAQELNGLNEQFKAIYGFDMEYMRPPEGEYSERLLDVASTMGYKTILWSFAYKDWDPDYQRGKEFAFNEVKTYLHDGAILLLHAVSKDNTEALGDIIEYAQENGYRFGELSEL